MPYKSREARLLHGKIYYEKNKEKLKLEARLNHREHSKRNNKRRKKWYRQHRDMPEYKKKILEQSRAYYLKNRDAQKIWHVNYWGKMRKELIDYMGGKCVKCGFKDIRALQIDHVNGGGTKEIRINNPQLKSPKLYKAHIEKNRNNYQLLCANCNWIKRSENNEYRKNAI